MIRRALTAGAMMALTVVMACGGGGGTTPACTNGDTRQCVGTGACAGGQVCTGGAWSACDCGGTNDGGVDGNTATDGATSDATDSGLPDITPYLKYCPQVPGTAPMVEIPALGGGSFCIDTRPITGDESVDARKAANPPAITECNLGINTPCQPIELSKGALPGNCVSWCRASGYCTSKGKRLCTALELRDACAGPSDFPWGLDRGVANARCPGTDVPSDQSTCRPPAVPQVFVADPFGADAEWTATFKQRTTITGGPTLAAAKAPFCGSTTLTSNGTSDNPGITFRCCADKK